jgi:enoyl-CoA hydratase/carnithine racemase
VEIDKAIHGNITKVVVFTSAKRTFLGTDFSAMYQLVDSKTGTDVARHQQRLFDRVNAIRVPTIAAIIVRASMISSF